MQIAKFRYLLTAILLVGFSAGCGGSSKNETVTIGLLNTDTGALSSTGPSVRIAADITEKEINHKLSSDNADFRIKIEIADTQTDPVKALEELQKFNDKGIKIVIGPLSSSEAIALSDYSIQNGIVLISPSSTATSLEKSSDLILRMPQSDTGHAKAITAALKYFGTRFYIPVWRGDTFGDDLVRTVGFDFDAAGGVFAPGARYDLNVTNFEEALKQLEIQLDAYIDFFGQRSSAVYAVAFDEVWSLLAQANQRGNLLRSVMWYGSDGIALNHGLLQSAEAVQFMVDTKMVSPIYAGSPSNQAFIDFRTEIETELGEKVKPYALLVHDAALLATEALKSLGNIQANGTILRDEMIRISSTISGVSGNLALNDKGDRVGGIFEFWRLEKDTTGTAVWTEAGNFDSESAIFTPK